MARRDLAAEVLELPLDERARLAHELIVSLEEEPPDPGAPEAWDREIERRLGELEAGTVKTRPWPAVRASITRGLRARRKRR